MVEPQSLLPIARFKAERLIAVGDPHQLRPTLRKPTDEFREATDLGKTLFVRLHRSGSPTHFLETQYRCHPAISGIANRLFYSDQLRDGISADQRSQLLPCLNAAEFINVGGEEKVHPGGSFTNPTEARLIQKFVRLLIRNDIDPSCIGVISLYKKQAELLDIMLNGESKSRNLSRSKKDSLFTIQVSTVDAFQGCEKDIILLSCVRTKAVGFTDSPLRLNVAITRAKYHLLIFGSRKLITLSPTWKQVIEGCVQISSTAHQLCSTTPVHTESQEVEEEEAMDVCIDRDVEEDLHFSPTLEEMEEDTPYDDPDVRKLFEPIQEKMEPPSNQTTTQTTNQIVNVFAQDQEFDFEFE